MSTLLPEHNRKKVEFNWKELSTFGATHLQSVTLLEENLSPTNFLLPFQRRDQPFYSEEAEEGRATGSGTPRKERTSFVL